MKFKDIDFHDHSDFDRPGPGLYLPGGYWVPKADVELAWDQVRQGLPAVGSICEYTTKEMCDDEFWSSIKIGKKLAIGRCVVFFVTNKMLPLKLVNRKKGGSRRYVRTDPVQVQGVPFEVVGGQPTANLKNDFVNVGRAENETGETK